MSVVVEELDQRRRLVEQTLLLALVIAVDISLAHSTDIVEPHAVPGTSKELALMECSAIDGPTVSVALGRGAATRAAKRLFARWECVAYKKTGWKPAFVRPLHRGYW